MNSKLRYLFLMVVSLIGFTTMGAGLPNSSPAGFDPINPPEPNPFYDVTVITVPSELAPPTANPREGGQPTSITAVDYPKYDFVCWKLDGAIVATERTYYFEMPYSPLTLTAEYEYNPNAFDPESPEEPNPSNPLHRVTIYYNPTNVHEPEVLRFEEDKEVNLTASSYTDYKFESWSRDGQVVSYDDNYTFVMPHEAISLTKNYRYDPDNATEPGEYHEARNTLIGGGYGEIEGGRLFYHHIRQSSTLSLQKLSFTVTFDERLSIDYETLGDRGYNYTLNVSRISHTSCRLEIFPEEGKTLGNGLVYSIPILSPSNLIVGEEMPVVLSDAVQVTTDNETYSAKTTNGTIKCIGNTSLVEGIEIEGGDRTVFVNTTSQFNAIITPEIVADTPVIWSTSDTSIATIDQTGLLTAKALGEVAVTATVDDISGLSATCTVTVIERPAPTVTLDREELQLTVTHSAVITATVSPETARQYVRWEIINGDDIVSMSEITDLTVRVTGNRGGNAVVRATAEDGSFAEAHITVSFLADDIQIIGGDCEVAVNQTLQLRTRTIPEDIANIPVEWQSLNPEIASVDQNGLVTAKAVGYAKILVTADEALVENNTAYTDIIVISNSSQSNLSLSYDGRTLRMSSNLPAEDYFFSTDNYHFEQTEQEVRLNPEIRRVYAYAVVDNNEHTDTVSIEIPCFYDGGEMYLHRENSMEKALEWCGGEVQTPTLTVIGRMGGEDFRLLRDQTGVIGLDFSETELTVAPSLGGMSWLKWASLPVVTDGSGMFEGCSSLAAVVWNSTSKMPSGLLRGVDNPNLLLYVPEAAAAADGVNNVVVGSKGSYRAERITLSDEGETNPYYAPMAFTAGVISYTRRFAQETGYDQNTRGYESLMLPFDVETVTHPVNGACAPFAADGGNGEKPFWLYRLGDEMEAAASIEAYKPYLISMPNNDRHYFDDYILGGNITFAAHDSHVEATPELTVGSHRGTMEPIARFEGVYALNVGEVIDGHDEGSVWVNNYRGLRTFEAYIVMADGPNNVKIFDTTGIEEVTLDEGENFKAWVDGGVICVVASSDAECGVYDVSGTLMARLSLTSGQVERSNPLGRGVYIVRVGKEAIKLRL